MSPEWTLVAIAYVALHVLGLGVLVFCYRSVVKMGRDASGRPLEEDPEARARIDELLRSSLNRAARP